MAVTALGMLFYFRRRGWLGELPDDDEHDQTP